MVSQSIETYLVSANTVSIGSFDLPMRQNLTRSSSMEVLVGDSAEGVSIDD
jgi:hypothetical protein